MPASADFNLYKFIHLHEPNSSVVLAGSATPTLSINEITSLSSDPAATSQVFRELFTTQRFNLGSAYGSESLRRAIANTYKPTSNLTAKNILAANGTTGANHILYRSLLTAGDHVIVQYPIYGPLIEEPRDIGCDITYFRLDPSNAWSPNLDVLEGLIKPGKTKMIILNNPVNPTGTHLETDVQRSIIRIAKKHDVLIHCDEIFRPLFHVPTTENEIPTSLNEHADLEYDNIITTSSLSKSYGLSGVRIGWMTTRSSALYKKFINYRMFSVQSLSLLDEAIATEALGPRCRPGILSKHLAIAKRNLDLIANFIATHSDQCEWVRPSAGAVAFVKFKNPHTGEPVDDVDFCERLVQSKKLLLSPGTLCFGFAEGDVGKGDGDDAVNAFKGRARFHFTAPTDLVEKGLKGLGEFLDDEKSAGLVNGVEKLKV